MSDTNKQKQIEKELMKQLKKELAAARSRVAELEDLESRCKRAMVEAQSQAAQIALIYETGQRLSGELELETLLPTVVTAVRDALGCYSVILLLLDEETQCLTAQSIASEYVDVFPTDVSLAVGEGMIGRAAETGETQISSDVSQEPYYVRYAQEETRSELAAPIKSGQKVIGVLDLQSDKLDAFGESDKVVIEALGTQIATAIENARLFDDAYNRAGRLEIVNHVAKVASATLDLDVLMERVYQEMAPAFQTDAFIIALYDEKAGELDLRFAMDEGTRQPPERLPLGAGLSSIVITERKPLSIHNLEQQQEYLSQAVLSGSGRHAVSWLGAPLMIGERVIGIISVQAYRPFAWDKEDEQLLLTISDQIALALENALLFQERKRRATELAIVNEIGQAIASVMELDDLLDTVHRQVNRLFDAVDFYIATYEEEIDEWSIPFWINHGQLLQSPTRYKAEVGLTGYIIRNRQHLILQSNEEIRAFHEAQGIKIEGIGEKPLSWLGVPLIVADKVVGAMAIQDYGHENLYDEQDVTLFSTIAAQVGPALNNLRLLEKTRRRAQEMQAINEVVQAISSILDLDAVLLQIVDVIKARFGHYFVCIALIDGERLFYRSGSTIGDSVTRIKSELWDGIDLMQTISIISKTAQTEQPVLINNVINNQQYRAIDELPDTQSELCVPIKFNERVIGALDVQSDQLAAYDQADVSLLQSLSNQAGVAIENARLFKEANIRAEELSVLNELAQDLTVRLSVQEVLEMAYRGVSRLMDASNFCIGLYNPEKEEVAFALNTIESEIDCQITVISASQGINGYIIRNRESVLIRENVAEWQKRAGIESVGETARSWLGVPMIIGDHVLGAMSVQSFSTPHAYDEHERYLLSAVANQTAIALQSARLYEAVEQELAERKWVEEALQQAYAEVEQQVEERTAELQRETAERERLQQKVIEAQKLTLQKLSTPIIPVMDTPQGGIIVMPLIGSIDSQRARDITRAMLAGIREHRAKVVILDITGVFIMDSGVANHLTKTIQAARLKGARAIVTGISDAVAETIVDLGIDWLGSDGGGGIHTLNDLQTGLVVALKSLGIKLCRA